MIINHIVKMLYLGVTVEPQDIKLINPSTGMIPNVNDTHHISLLIHSHRRLAFFESEEGKKEFEEWKRQRETKE